MSFGGFNQGGNTTPMSEINTTPLVDVMLVLLVVFIVTAPLLTHAIPIVLPQEVASEHNDSDHPDAIQITINKEGTIHANNVPISLPELEQKFLAETAKDPNVMVSLRADEETLYRNVAAVMATGTRSRIQAIRFITEHPVSK